MPFFTYGAIHVTPALLSASVELESIAEALGEALYSGAIPSSGWAAIRIQDEADARPNLRRSSPGKPTVIELGGLPVLLARLFVDRPRTIQAADAAGLALEARFTLDAIDVVILPPARGSTFRVFVASKDPQDMDIVSGALKSALAAEDMIGFTPTPVETLPDPDFFLWLLHRLVHENGKLSDRMTIVEYRTVSATESPGRITRSLGGVDIDRTDVLGSIADGHPFGPAKFVVFDTQTSLVADLFVLADGTFDVYRQGTYYDDDEGPRGRSFLGVRSAIDVGTDLLPHLFHEHDQDLTWRESRRDAFRAECRKKLADRYS